MKRSTAKGKFLTSMVIFGTVGVLTRYIPLSSALLAFFRGLLGLLFLALVMLLSGKRPDKQAIGKNLPVLCLSGIALGGNWILLFESFRYTTVAAATVCYYLAPVLLVLAAPLYGEKLTLGQLPCILAALAGLVCVSGVLESGMGQADALWGILLAIGAAVLYAAVMLMNKTLKAVGAYEKTILQLASSCIVILPYLLMTGGFILPRLEAQQWMLLLVLGIVHTGVAYALYFGAIRDLNAQTVAVFSYLDPVVAVLVSALLLRESITPLSVLGTVLVLCSAFYTQLPKKTGRPSRCA